MFLEFFVLLLILPRARVFFFSGTFHQIAASKPLRYTNPHGVRSWVGYRISDQEMSPLHWIALAICGIQMVSLLFLGHLNSHLLGIDLMNTSGRVVLLVYCFRNRMMPAGHRSTEDLLAALSRRHKVWAFNPRRHMTVGLVFRTRDFLRVSRSG